MAQSAKLFKFFHEFNYLFKTIIRFKHLYKIKHTYGTLQKLL